MNANTLPWTIHRGQGPLIATAIHDGHDVREDLRGEMALGEAERLREEDPWTGQWTMVAPTRLIARQSRFEVDLNRPRGKAVYLTPDDAWGLDVWRTRLSRDAIRKSQAIYDAFYGEVDGLLRRMVARYGKVVVLDLHTYNHRRQGPDGPEADPLRYPEVNVGSGTMDRAYWSPLVDRFIVDLRNADYPGGNLDVRENVCFRGGNLAAWIHEHFPKSVCVLSVEFKKTFMDEWTGEADPMRVFAIEQALQSTVWGLHEELVKMGLRERGMPA